MPDLADQSWKSVYESDPTGEGTYLVDEFYVPALSRSIRYDRIAGYFSSSALAVASRGIHALEDNDGEMRIVVGVELYETDRPVLEALTDELGDELEELDDEQLDAQLQLLAHLLREGRLHIKVAIPREGSWRIFHPKMGIFHDEAGNALSFEGSVNETVGGWKRNYERFKVHRSWVDEQAAYVDGDVDTFDRLWRDEHPFVEVHDLPEAIEEDLIDWKAPDTNDEVDEVVQIARGEAPPTERDKANIIADGPLSPGGLALAEHGSTITPWPHQRVVSDTLVNTYPNSFLLCDEVGLGKTIEAGLTLSRLGLTDELETGLLLVPASLTIQWQEELWEKFNLNAYRFDRGSDYEYTFIDAFGQEHAPPSVADLGTNIDRDQAWVESPIWRFLHAQDDGEPLDGPNIVIMSWHTARLEGRWDQVAPRDGGDVRTRDDVPASCRGRSSAKREGVWDAVIVDEAHNARRNSNFYHMLDRLRDHTQAYYLLTATPMQLHAGELYDLMTLLDLPTEWDDRDDFVEFFETRSALEQALGSEVDGDSAGGSTDRSPTQATLDGRYQDSLPTDRSVSDQIFDAIASNLDINEDQPRAIAKTRVLNACTLAGDYGDHYDGYVETLEDAMNEYDIDPFDAKEDDKLKYLLYPEWKVEQEWLTFSRGDRLDALDELTESGWRVIRDVLAESTPVDALIHRNTRDTLRRYEQVGLLDETVPNRNPEQRQIELTDATREVYDRIDEYTRKFYKLAQQSSEADSRAIGFVMTTYRQRLTSSVYAISQSLQNRLEKLRAQRTVMKGKQRAAERSYGDAEQSILDTISEYDLSDFDALNELEGDIEDADLAEVIPNVTDEGINLLDQEIEELESFVSELTRIEQDPKIEQLIDDLNALDHDGHNRIIVFTQYADTMDFIRDSLVSIHGETVATYSGRGGEIYDSEQREWRSVGKERVKREFAADGGQVDILVCTDSASEGLNLQECGALINYDLPWNPMRVEQRIGRIDRIGQRYDDVTILNYSYKDTVETDIYDRLDDRIGLFENVVGDMQPILSGVSEQIRSATLEAEDEDRDEAVDRADSEFSERIEEQRESDRVDVGESLDSVDTLVADEVIDNARLSAWGGHNHPDVDAVGADEYACAAPFTPSAVESLFTSSKNDSSDSVLLTPVAEIEFEDQNTELIDDFEYSEHTYRLHLSGTHGVEIQIGTQEGTAAQAIAPESGFAVTFSEDCAREYPSIHFLAPGHPLLKAIVQYVLEASEESIRLQKYIESRELEPETPVVCGWKRDGRLQVLSADKGVVDGITTNGLQHWFDTFTSNRDSL
ncbi:helicase-related protein [Halorientalis regularis]|uniref:SNF2 family N-terminal domain-containing protein n=1 Tax=Halorientalis regularis TaxID=660518 RepID=A0A1G7U0N2_9EURY|nr:helicase-related protein [Halorientalis regularis]SDG40340.1 SNF2 family N-terminal domain-containing protein [Halorientalis regularis]